MPANRNALTPLLVLALLYGPGSAGVANGQSISTNRLASHQLGFSGAFVSVQEDYRHTKWPVAHCTFILRGPSGRVITMSLADGGAGRLDALSLYKRIDEKLDQRGHAIGGSYVLVGSRVCVGFDPIFLAAAQCIHRPPCGPGNKISGLVYLGSFEWANGYDPPHGDFQFGWRFLPFEDGGDVSSCEERRPSRRVG